MRNPGSIYSLNIKNWSGSPIDDFEDDSGCDFEDDRYCGSPIKLGTTVTMDSRFRGNDKKGAGMTKRNKEYWIPNQVGDDSRVVFGDDKLLDPR